MKTNDSRQLISVRACRESPFKSITIDKTSKAKPLMESNFSNCRRQDLPRAYAPNGAMYFFTIDFFRNYGSFPFEGSDTFIMSSDESIDIDDEKDLKDAERLLRGLFT
jgi:CMP-N-acetylneuraminic acid synthetase